MNKRKITIIIILILALITLALTIYAKKEKNIKPVEEHKFLYHNKLSNAKKDLIYSDTLDKDTYSNEIINEQRTNINYNFYDDKKSIVGKIYIDDDKYLNITNTNENDILRLPGIKFRTMYLKEVKYNDGIYLWLISEDNDLYCVSLTSNNIKETKLTKIDTKYKVLNFTNLNFDSDLLPSGNTLFVLEEDGNIYEITSGLRYTSEIKSIFDNILVFKDNTIANIYGNVFENKEGKLYKIKYVFNSKPSEVLKNHEALLIITDDNKLISALYDEKLNYVHEFSKKIKSINFEKNVPFVNGKLIITFEDDYNLEFDAYCSAYYCINKFNI